MWIQAVVPCFVGGGLLVSVTRANPVGSPPCHGKVWLGLSFLSMKLMSVDATRQLRPLHLFAHAMVF